MLSPDGNGLLYLQVYFSIAARVEIALVGGIIDIVHTADIRIVVPLILRELGTAGLYVVVF